MKKRKPLLGQHFLSDLLVAKDIVRHACISPDDHVVEIGPGKGVLTYDLVKQAKKITAIETDPKLCHIIEKKFGGGEKFSLIQGDAVKFDYSLLGPRFKLVSNLPYYAATPILKRLIHYRKYIDDMTVMLQKEVAYRLAAEPGTKSYGSLSVFTQFHCTVERLMDVGKSAFSPPPKVMSTVLRLTPREDVPVAEEHQKTFFHLVHAAFFHKRKTLGNNLKGLHKHFEINLGQIEQAGIDISRRAETLSMQDFATLTQCLVPKHG